ncbi:MAG: tetratricopeptide repeat protein [Thermodesulfovibrionales bacterium]|nr:tetratricopeptide repeat protein [Thermodesulfovibrionales bacterium]
MKKKELNFLRIGFFFFIPFLLVLLATYEKAGANAFPNAIFGGIFWGVVLSLIFGYRKKDESTKNQFSSEPKTTPILKASITFDEENNAQVEFEKLHPDLKHIEYVRLVLHYYAKLLADLDPNQFESDLLYNNLLFFTENVSNANLKTSPDLLQIANINSKIKISYPKSKSYCYIATFYAYSVTYRHLTTEIPMDLKHFAYSLPVLIQGAMQYLDDLNLNTLQIALKWMNEQYRNGFDYKNLFQWESIPYDAFFYAIKNDTAGNISGSSLVTHPTELNSSKEIIPSRIETDLDSKTAASTNSENDSSDDMKYNSDSKENNDIGYAETETALKVSTPYKAKEFNYLPLTIISIILIITIIISVFFILFSPASKSTISKKELNDTEIYLAEGSKKIENQDYNGAIQDFTKVIDLNPTNAVTYFYRGNAKSSNEDYDGAILDYSKAIELDPKVVNTYINRGLAKDINKDLMGAMMDYSKALELDPKNVDAFDKRGRTKAKLEDYRGAILDYTKAIELDPKYAAAYYYRGRAMDELKDYHGAIKDYTKTIELYPKDAETYLIYLRRGFAKAYLKDYIGTIDDLTKVIELDPNNSDAYYLRGFTKIEVGDKKGGCLDLSKAGELGNAEAYELIKKYCN